MSFFQRFRRLATAEWTDTAPLAAATAAPTLATDGTAMGAGGGTIQYGTHTLVAVTDYDLRLWLLVDGEWMAIQEHFAAGEVPRIWEYVCCALGATRYAVQLAALTGTSLVLKTRQV